MALTIGSVAVDENGNATGSGLSKDLYDRRKTAADTTVLAQEAFGAEGEADEVAFLQFLAEDSEAIAEAIVDHVRANGEAVITTSDGALQVASGVSTDPPSAERRIGLD